MHVPCPSCGSSDAGWLFEDGGMHCYKCHHHAHPQEESKPRVISKVPPQLLTVEVEGIPSRKLTDETCQKYGYGWGTYKGQKVQVASYRNLEGDLVGQKLRFKDKSFAVLGKITGCMFGMHLFAKGQKKLVVCEGEIDALTMSQVQDNRWPAVSVPNGASGAASAVLTCAEWLESFDEVVFMFDMDEPGQEAAKACAALLSPGRGFIAHLPMKDPNEMLVANRRAELKTAMWEAREHRPDGILLGDEIWEAARRWSAISSTPYGHQGLQSKLRGQRQGELVVLCAGPGVGKSVWCRERAYELVLGGAKVGYMALEENPRDTLLGLLTPPVGRNLRLEEPDMDELKGVLHETYGDKLVTYNHSGRKDDGSVQSKLRYMALGLGCRFVFLDNLSIVVGQADSNERQWIDQLMRDLAGMVAEIGFSLVLVCHLKRPKEGRAHSEGRRTSLSDLRGSGMLEAMAYDVIGLERDLQDEEDEDMLLTGMRVLKTRNGYGTGHAGWLRFDRRTGRLLEHDREDNDFAVEEGADEGFAL